MQDVIEIIFRIFFLNIYVTNWKAQRVLLNVKQRYIIGICIMHNDLKLKKWYIQLITNVLLSSCMIRLNSAILEITFFFTLQCLWGKQYDFPNYIFLRIFCKVEFIFEVFFARWTSSWNAACNLSYMKIASGKQQRKLITKLCKNLERSKRHPPACKK